MVVRTAYPTLLIDRLRRVCNISQQPSSAMELINQDLNQMALPGFHKAFSDARQIRVTIRQSERNVDNSLS
ncbi:MAG: hypothetical protein ACXWT1_00370 [Methylobacter sp.]